MVLGRPKSHISQVFSCVLETTDEYPCHHANHVNDMHFCPRMWLVTAGNEIKERVSFQQKKSVGTLLDGTCWRWVGNGTKMKLAWKKRKHIKARIRCVVSFFVFFQAISFWFRFLLTVNKYRPFLQHSSWEIPGRTFFMFQKHPWLS